MAASDKAALDVCEGLGNGYEQEGFNFPQYGDVVAYLASESHIDNSLAPFVEYQGFVLAGAEYHGFPSGYIERIASFSACEDPEPDRRFSNQRLLGELIGS